MFSFCKAGGCRHGATVEFLIGEVGTSQSPWQNAEQKQHEGEGFFLLTVSESCSSSWWGSQGRIHGSGVCSSNSSHGSRPGTRLQVYIMFQTHSHSDLLSSTRLCLLRPHDFQNCDSSWRTKAKTWANGGTFHILAVTKNVQYPWRDKPKLLNKVLGKISLNSNSPMMLLILLSQRKNWTVTF